MRKNVSYFERKMEFMQKLTTMDWIAERVRRTKKGTKKNYRRMYFRYESMSEIEAKLREGQVLSGLTTMKNKTEFLEGHIWLVFGKKGSKVSIVPLRLTYDGKCDTLIGLSYHQYELVKDMVFDNLDTERLK